jgi:hypothetical protein
MLLVVMGMPCPSVVNIVAINDLKMCGDMKEVSIKKV